MYVFQLFNIFLTLNRKKNILNKKNILLVYWIDIE